MAIRESHFPFIDGSSTATMPNIFFTSPVTYASNDLSVDDSGSDVTLPVDISAEIPSSIPDVSILEFQLSLFFSEVLTGQQIASSVIRVCL